jgi:hypothetical protein
MGCRSHLYPRAGWSGNGGCRVFPEPVVRIIALLVGGGVALTSHGTKAAIRATANVSPEPFSNIALSLAEDTIAVGSSFLVAWFPLVMLGIVMLFLTVFFWLAPKILRTIRRGFGLAGAP